MLKFIKSAVMKIFSNFKRKHRFRNVDECFYFQKKTMMFTGCWPQNSLKNWKFALSFFLISIILIAKVIFLINVIDAGDFEQTALVLPQLIITLGYFWVSFLMLSFEKVLKTLLDEFEVEWNLSKFHLI